MGLAIMITWFFIARKTTSSSAPRPLKQRLIEPQLLLAPPAGDHHRRAEDRLLHPTEAAGAIAAWYSLIVGLVDLPRDRRQDLHGRSSPPPRHPPPSFFLVAAASVSAWPSPR